MLHSKWWLMRRYHILIGSAKQLMSMKRKKENKKDFAKIFLHPKLKLALLEVLKSEHLIVLQKWTAMINRWLWVTTANKGQSMVNYHQSLVFDHPYLACIDHCDWWLFQEVFYYYFYFVVILLKILNLFSWNC